MNYDQLVELLKDRLAAGCPSCGVLLRADSTTCPRCNSAASGLTPRKLEVEYRGWNSDGSPQKVETGKDFVLIYNQATSRTGAFHVLFKSCRQMAVEMEAGRLQLPPNATKEDVVGAILKDR